MPTPRPLRRFDHPARPARGPQRRPGQAAQALVEFALVAPVLLLMIGATVDMGRGLLLYGLLQGASRDTARQAALSYYSGSNLLPPDCTALTTPCSLKYLVNGAHALDVLGVDPADAVMVGDSLEEDVEGARALGMRAILVDREDRHPDVEERLTDLYGLPAALGLPRPTSGR